MLATPAAAPWMKISEAVDYLRAVAPTRAVPIHQAIIDPSARGIYYGRLTEMTDTDFQVLEPENGTGSVPLSRGAERRRCRAAARPAARPEKTHPPRNVPSSER